MRDEVPSSKVGERPAQLNRYMRATSIFALMALVAFGAEAQQIPRRSTPDLQIEEHLSTIGEPSRATIVVAQAEDGSQSRKQSVQVRGSISEEAVTELVRTVWAEEFFYSQNKGEWEVLVVGDSKHAKVAVNHRCAAPCGHGRNETYSFEKGRWVLIYGSLWRS